jgi:hypothetical protein
MTCPYGLTLTEYHNTAYPLIVCWPDLGSNTDINDGLRKTRGVSMQ